MSILEHRLIKSKNRFPFENRFQPSCDELRSPKLEFLRQLVGFFQQSFFNAHRNDLNAIADGGPAALRFARCHWAFCAAFCSTNDR